MSEQKTALPHKLTLDGRQKLTMNGVTEVIRFDDETAVLHTSHGTLMVHGTGLQLKTLSLDGGQVAVDGNIQALIYEAERPGRAGRRRIFP